MTLPEFYTSIKEALSIPVAYDHFDVDEGVDEPLKPPFLSYVDIGKNTFEADNVSYITSYALRVELYTEVKDVSLEAKLEKFFDDNLIKWDDEPTTYIPEENLYLHPYNIIF